MTLICRDATHQPKITSLEAENADLRTALEGALRQKTEAEERGEQLALEMGKRERELREKLQRYGTHETTCNEHFLHSDDWGKGCQCGWSPIEKDMNP